MASESSKTIRKGGLSCSECRRSKLKCDRVFPCQSCIKRGCAALCPDGELEATRGNKVLAQRVQDLTSKVKELERALAEAEVEARTARSSSSPSDGHLSDKFDPLLVPPNPDEFETMTRATAMLGALGMDDDGRARFYGETACPRNLLLVLVKNDNYERTETHDIPPLDNRLPNEVLEFANAFPFGNLRPRTTFEYAHLLPSYDEVLRLMDLYYDHCGYSVNPLPKLDLMITVVDVVYAVHTMPIPEVVHAHRMSAFLTILAIGCVCDADPTIQSKGRFYESLARAVFATDPLLGTGTVSTVITMYLMIQFSYYTEKSRSGNDLRWLLLGISARVSQSIGLHRSSESWKLTAEESENRRRTFWELYFWDATTSLMFGRPSCLNIKSVDTKFPEDVDAILGPDGSTRCSYHAWKFRYGATVLASLTDVLLSGRMPDYSLILTLDQKIRQFPVPEHLQVPELTNEDWTSPIGPWPEDPNLALWQMTVLCLRKTNFLHIHRAYCMAALRENPSNPLQTEYAPSVLAAYRSAFRAVRWLQSLIDVHPERALRVWFFEAVAYSSCVMLAAIVAGSPSCSISRNGLEHLDFAVGVLARFNASSWLERVRKLQRQARIAVGNTRGSSKSTNAEPDDAMKFVQVTELQVYGGCASLTDLARPLGAAPSAISSPRLSPRSGTSSSTSSQPPPHYPSHSQFTLPGPASLFDGPGQLYSPLNVSNTRSTAVPMPSSSLSSMAWNYHGPNEHQLFHGQGRLPSSSTLQPGPRGDPFQPSSFWDPVAQPASAPSMAWGPSTDMYEFYFKNT